MDCPENKRWCPHWRNFAPVSFCSLFFQLDYYKWTVKLHFKPSVRSEQSLEPVWLCGWTCVWSNFKFFFFAKIKCGLYFFDRFDVLMSKMIFKKWKKYYWHIFRHEKLFEKQLLPHCQTPFKKWRVTWLSLFSSEGSRNWFFRIKLVILCYRLFFKNILK